VTGLGPPYVTAFPVPPGNIIRLTHKLRPGYTPTKIATPQRPNPTVRRRLSGSGASTGVGGRPA